MKVAPSSRPNDYLQAYLSLLGAPSGEDHVLRIVDQVRTSLGANVRPPIRLSTVARQFDIEPRPEFDSEIGDGELRCRSSSPPFVIRLNARFGGQATRMSSSTGGIWGDARDLESVDGIGRCRFTYAHEFCHRFFFVPVGDSWQRAVVCVTEAIQDQQERLRAIRTISSLEERWCQGAAGELLMPSPHLVPLVGDILDPPSGINVPEFFELARLLQRTYGVSLDCAFVRLERLVRLGQIRCRGGFAAMLVEWSSKKGTASQSTSGKSRQDLRVRSSIIPRVVSERAVRPLFPGLALRNLGPDLMRVVEERHASGSDSPEQGLDVPLCVQVKDFARGWTSHQVRLVGRSRVIGARDVRSSALLLWGTVRE